MSKQYELTMEASDLRELCVAERWCTRMDNDAYSRLLNMTLSPITVEVLEDMATRIYERTSKYHDADEMELGDDDVKWTKAYIMSKLNRICWFQY